MKLDTSESNTLRKTRAELEAIPLASPQPDGSGTGQTTLIEVLEGAEFVKRLPSTTIYPQYAILRMVKADAPAQGEHTDGHYYRLHAFNVEVTDAEPDYKKGLPCPTCASADTLSYPSSAMSDQHKCLACPHEWKVSAMAGFLNGA